MQRVHRHKATINLKELRERKQQEVHSHNGNQAGETIEHNNEVCEIPSQMDGRYDSYVAKHGKRFTRSLYNHAVAMLSNRDGSDHRWSDSEVYQAMGTLGLKIEPLQKMDAAYLANMYYARFYGSSVTDALQCVKMAHDTLTSPSYYGGQIFDWWVGEMINREMPIDWSRFNN